MSRSRGGGSCPRRRITMVYGNTQRVMVMKTKDFL
ncbi:unnamed protein product [Musa acuminata subsp. malaccensis]|uniref:(wild Malaysian banana) hypothetical protein n=1 Tax=Musa acuminata subsp. malaccensis TaxID=214687 RepID=A0A804I600_MUSAM|nr:unnamed protein product [Musa acuminata subsp. malaccensis]